MRPDLLYYMRRSSKLWRISRYVLVSVLGDLCNNVQCLLIPVDNLIKIFGEIESELKKRIVAGFAKMDGAIRVQFVAGRLEEKEKKENIADHLDSFLHSLIVESSYAKVAKKIGISSMYLWEIIHGCKLPSFEVLRKICDSLAENPNSKYAFLSSVLLRDKKKAFALKMAIRREKWLQ